MNGSGATVHLPGVPVGVRYVRNIELLKWLGVVCMLVDHLFLYVFGETNMIAERVGALAFPLFAIALSAGLCLRHEDYAWQILPRMVFFAVVAQVASLVVRDGFPLNVIFTLALGVWGHLIWRSEHSLARRVGLSAGILALGMACEFSAVGVLLVWLLLDAMRSERWESLGLPLIVLAMLSPFNSGSHFALLSPFVVLLVAAFSFELPRVRGVFYWAYVLQFPVLWLAATAV